MTTETEAAPTGHMTLWEHLAELRSRLFRVAFAVGAGALLGWFLYPYVLEILKHPFNEVQPGQPFIATEPLQAFALRLKMSGYIGFAIAMPVVLWQIWRFVTPGLHPHEKKYAVPFTASAIVLFFCGATLAFYVLNPTLQFLTTIGGSQIEPFYTASSYVTLIIWMMLAFGVGFEFPVLLVALQMIGVVTPRKLIGWWRQAVVTIALVAAVITPSGDPISMTALALPMALLYIMSIGIGALVLALRRRSRRRNETQTDDVVEI
ncbi:MAG: twin-arginine translocase subunit TatC [Acidimicrobiales bacterium]